MIATMLLCVVAPFAPGCSPFVRDVPTIAQVVADQAHYAGRDVGVTGRVQKMRQWRSRTDSPLEVFVICDRACINVYIPEHSAIHDGELVTVRGVYYQAYRLGPHLFQNEIRGTEVLPRE